MIVKRANYLIFITFIITAIGLFYIKDNVRNISYQLTEVKKQLEEEKDKIYLLKAEVAYLTAPQRLKKSIANYLSLESVKITQMVHDPIDNITSNNSDNKIALNVNKDIIRIKWRFKRNPTKYKVEPVALRKKH